LIVGFAGEVGGVTWTGGGDDVDAEGAFAQARDGGAGELGGTATTGSGVDDGEEGFSHNGAASCHSPFTEKAKTLASYLLCEASASKMLALQLLTPRQKGWRLTPPGTR
jgi:hypothetical protein